MDFGCPYPEHVLFRQHSTLFRRCSERALAALAGSLEIYPILAQLGADETRGNPGAQVG